MRRVCWIAALSTVVAGALLAGCSVPVSLWQDNTVDINATDGMPLSMTSTTTVDLTQQSQFSADLKAVTSLQIPEVQIQISNVQPDNQATTVSGSLTITNPDDASWTPVTLSFTDAPITEGGIINLTPAAADVDRLSDMLLAEDRFNQVTSASVNALPADFVLTSRVHVIAYVDLTKL